jgi:hypothetical protein
VHSFHETVARRLLVMLRTPSSTLSHITQVMEPG